ncbi:DUF2304 domain-containing protein [Intrasporangium calvum]|uniref:DUF2304 domain-containing protein n=1 Tax=Intrasporangium calvum (strain ATCC 23552 / DSM 43043 / JCM 3097 / NBRC 12989 / NCIMB 10167 / NRRL B-3866 / 7 KIP) TaxID=710696 RepID=E6SFQ1_INTC7|nr:DUF2304 domain-containing protein [Intrasporangium calvum]ADU47796.1 hypothetical protein Intca_1278 [Intrasporangium calvum DSM 43043]AXG12910.1 DUF2304 domain-containing protein [Intrasporangium calvum]
MSRQSVIQIILIAATLAIAWRLLAGSGQRTQAVRRLGLLALAGLAVYSIIDPSKTWTSLAQALGVGRGADLILYGLVVAFLGFVVTTFKRFREMEVRYTRLARRIALDEAVPVRDAFPPDRPARPTPSTPTPKGTDAD